MKSADLNDIQDMVIGGKRGSVTRVMLPTIRRPGDWLYYPVFSISMLFIQSSGPQTGDIAIPCYQGETVTGVVVSAAGNGSIDVAYMVYAIGPIMGTDQIKLGSATDVGRSAAWGDVVIPITPHKLAPGWSLVLTCTASAAGARIGNVRVTSHLD
ncbi:MAG: hypothetical protein ACTHU0_01445 [Kofleriaceae bacterium]